MGKRGIAASVALVVTALSGSAVLAANSEPLFGFGIAAAVVGFIWILWPRRPQSVPRRYAIFLGAFVFSSVLPPSLGMPLQIWALVGAFVEWLAAPATVRRGGSVVLAAALFIAFWGLLVFHPNVPDVSTGLLGFRKTALAVAGVALGAAVSQHLREAVERLVIKFLAAIVAVSIVGHLWVPAINALSPKNDAETYTGIYDGEQRMQGLFAGPFHAALAGVFLIGWALVRWKSSRFLPKVVLLVGSLGMYLTLVRTAYVAVALVICSLIILASSLTSFLKRAALVGAIAVVGLMVGESLGGGKVVTVALSIGNFATDGRFLNRLPEYALGLSMFQESPYVGMGAGSAGDTLGAAFGGNPHVTPHNLLLKILVEGGLIGFILWLLLMLALWRSLNIRTPHGTLAVVSLLGMFGLGITGSAIEALPVTYLIFIVVGLGLTQRRLGETDMPRNALPIQGASYTLRPRSVDQRAVPSRIRARQVNTAN